MTVALADKREMPAKVIGVDPATDLALLKIDAKDLPTMPWGDSSKLKVAEWVLAIGNPYQLNQTVTLGIVSAVGRTNLGVSTYEDFVQTDAAINPGNSGGALVNGRGELVGINTVIFSQSGGYQGIGFAVSSNLAQARRQRSAAVSGSPARLDRAAAESGRAADDENRRGAEASRHEGRADLRDVAQLAGLPGRPAAGRCRRQLQRHAGRGSGTLRAAGVGRAHRQHRDARRDPRGHAASS